MTQITDKMLLAGHDAAALYELHASSEALEAIYRAMREAAITKRIEIGKHAMAAYSPFDMKMVAVDAGADHQITPPTDEECAAMTEAVQAINSMMTGYDQTVWGGGGQTSYQIEGCQMTDEVPDVSFTFGDKTIRLRDYVRFLGRGQGIAIGELSISRDKDGVISVRYGDYSGRIGDPHLPVMPGLG